MPKLFDAPIENIIDLMRKERIGKKIFAYESLIGKRIIRHGGTPIVEGIQAFFFFENPDKKKSQVYFLSRSKIS